MNNQLNASSINTNNAQDSLFYDVFLKYRVTHVDSALKYAKLSYSQSIDLGDTELSIKSLNAIGYCYHRKSILDSALFIYKKGVSISKETGNELREMYFYNSIGLVYDDAGTYDSAIANFYSSLELARKLNQDKDISVALTNIGNINFDLGNIKSAINYYTESLEIKERNNYPGLEITYYNTGLCYDALGDHTNAIKSFNKVIDICESGNCNQYYVDKGLLGLGISYFGMKAYDIAEEYMDKVKDSQDIQTRIIAYRYLSELALNYMNYDQALDYVDHSTHLARSISSRESLKLNYLLKSRIFRTMGQSDSALYYFQYHYDLKDSLFNETVAKSIQDLFVGFERQQADAEIQVKEREIFVRKRTNILLALVILLSLSLLVKFLMDLSKRKKINLYLDREVTKKTSEIRKTNKSLSEKSRDLNNLVYNISHEIRGPLARLLGLINIGKMESKEEANAIRYYEELRNEAIDLERILKKMIIINNVNHHEVHKVKVNPKEFFDKVLDNSRYVWQDKIIIHMDLNGITEFETDSIMLEMALQNMIDNAVKFRSNNPGETSKLDIHLTKNANGGTNIILEDNGNGFDEKFKDSVTDLFFVASEKGGTGMGLHQTKLALEKIKAEFEVISSRNPTVFAIHL